MSEGYNGWTNWDTWEAYNWLGNSDEDVYNDALVAIEEGGDVAGALASLLSETDADVDIEAIDWDELITAIYGEE